MSKWVKRVLIVVGVLALVIVLAFAALLAYDEITRPARCEQALASQRQALAAWGADASLGNAAALDIANATVLMVCHGDKDALNNLLR